MNVGNVTALFHQNRLFGQKLTRPPVSDVLQRLSENRLSLQEQTDRKARFDTLELSAEATEPRSGLEEMPEGLLHYYLHMCQMGAHLSGQQEVSLTEYRDQLAAFDQTIQDYQDMLDGRTALPAQCGPEEVAALLEAAKAAREQFLQGGAEELNRLSREGPTLKGFLGSAYPLVAGGTDRDESRWELDPSAGDIYGQIDRALAAAHEVTSTFREGASGFLAELKRRGCVQAGEEPSPEPADSGAVERASLFQSLYEDLWNGVRQSLAGTHEA